MKSVFKYRLSKKWWFNNTRGYTWFSFRYWWVNYLLWFAFISFLIWLIMKLTNPFNDCPEQQEVNALMRKIERDFESCCECRPEKILDTIPRAPSKNCRVHFSGLIMGGNFEMIGISEIYKEDFASEYVGSGYYPENSKAFPKAVNQTFDGIAIDAGTHLIMYSMPNFKGEVLLDIKGPAIINNVLFIEDERYNHCNSDVYPSNLESNFPPSVRKWSSSNMQNWSNGSCKIICDE